MELMVEFFLSVTEIVQRNGKVNDLNSNQSNQQQNNN
jgi:hypothetical protein